MFKVPKNLGSVGAVDFVQTMKELIMTPWDPRTFSPDKLNSPTRLPIIFLSASLIAQFPHPWKHSITMYGSVRSKVHEHFEQENLSPTCNFRLHNTLIVNECILNETWRMTSSTSISGCRLYISFHSIISVVQAHLILRNYKHAVCRRSAFWHILLAVCISFNVH